MTRFTKVEGLGNDFVLVERESVAQWPLARVRKVCDRHRGVGADGVLLLSSVPGADARMVVLNADGSRPEMCGNGLRCAALYLAERTGRTELVVLTDAGVRHALVHEGDVTVSLGEVRVLGEVVLGEAAHGATWTQVEAGNPHLVSFDLAPKDALRVGPALAVHSLFPMGTNVECARISKGEIELVVWERGAGYTLACGTGAAATAALAWAKGLLPAGPTRVHLPGGALTVWPEGKVLMQRGPARVVYSGVV